MNKPPIVRTTRANAEPTRILVIGTRENVGATIDHLCTLGFCDRVQWSKIQPQLNETDQFFSIMTQWIV